MRPRLRTRVTGPAATPAAMLLALGASTALAQPDQASPGQATPSQPAPSQPAQAQPAPAQPAADGEPPSPVRDPFFPADQDYDFQLSAESGLSPGESPTSTGLELEEIYSPHTGVFGPLLVERPLNGVVSMLSRLQQETGLRFGMAYTTVFQQASAGPGERTAWGGDLDLLLDWTLIGRGTKDTGRFFVSGEYRHQIDWEAPNQLSTQIGSLQRTTGGFDDRGWVLRDLYWVQRLFDDHLRLGVGRADASDWVGGHRLQNINNSFSNRQFSANSVTPFPGHGLNAGVSVRPSEQFYLTLGAADANGDTTEVDPDSLTSQWELFYYGETGFTPTITDLGPGRYRLFCWYVDEREQANRPSDWGLSVILEQDLGESLQAFGRYSWADEGLTPQQQAAEVGIGYRGLMGSPNNLLGAAVGVSQPTNEDLRNQTTVEVFHRWQVTVHSQFSLGVQGIFNPSNAPGDDSLAVLTARYRIAF